jgi:hypothetical protein
MKITISILLTGLALCQMEELPVTEYYRGRAGYEQASLKLYEQGRYSYRSWMHLGYYLTDTGSYRQQDNILILTSLASRSGNTRVKKKSKEQAFLYFKQDSLLIEKDRIIMPEKGERLNQLDSTLIKQRILTRKL